MGSRIQELQKAILLNLKKERWAFFVNAGLN